jgi:fatty-acyl-CoA synthase
MQFNLAQLHEVIAATVPDREALVFRDLRLTYAQLANRSNRLANFLLGNGIKVRREREELSNWESGQDHVAIYMYNCNQYMETMLGAYKARAVPFNVNYRYVEQELVYLLNNARAKAIAYHAEFAPRLRAIRDQLRSLELLLQVADDSNEPLLEGAIDYEAALASASAETPRVDWSPDDLYMLFTGGTTGMPKGVLWRQGDIIVSGLGGRKSNGSIIESIDEFLTRVNSDKTFRFLPAPPFMHGTGHWAAFDAWHSGNTVVIQDQVKNLDPKDILNTAERESVNVLLLVGDAFARPLLEELRSGHYQLAALKTITSSGAVLSVPVKEGIISAIPHVKIIDSVGSSETGTQGRQISSFDGKVSTGRFSISQDSVVLNVTRDAILRPGHDELGWWAKRGHVPLGYLGDEAKTQETFPEISGQRYSVPGDRVRLLANGDVEFLGRDSTTINTGGEKVFAEEVELALKHHPDVLDALVAGRQSERWGNEVVAIVQLRDGCAENAHSLLAECEKHVARYKLPKAFRFVDEVQRAPNGKADYKWARKQALLATWRGQSSKSD